MVLNETLVSLPRESQTEALIRIVEHGRAKKLFKALDWALKEMPALIETLVQSFWPIERAHLFTSSCKEQQQAYSVYQELGQRLIGQGPSWQ